jgi:PE-PPE domain
MRTANYIGRIGALAVTLGVGIAAAAAPGVAMAEAADSSDSTALMLGGTGIPTWNDADVELIMNQFIAPTHPGQTIEPVAVTTPSELWPAGPWAALICLALCPTSVLGPGGSGWLLDEPMPLWKLSGLFSRTINQSVRAGVADLETAMAEHGNDDLVIYGYSQGAMVANREKRKLAEQYPGPEAPDIDFVLSGDPNLPNGGLLARFPGLYIPILDFSFNGPEPTDTQFDTTVITQQYDLFADFPLYPLNFIADVNALLGFIYVHLYPFDVSLADPSTPLPDTHGNNDYYFFETNDLPLFGPLRTLGVPEALIDVFEPFFRVLVELGYDRTIAPWEPTPARLIPRFDPVTLVTDLVDAIGEGINNAAALLGSPAPLSSTAAQPTTKQVVSAPETTLSISPDGVAATTQSMFVAGQPLATPSSTPTPAPTPAPKLEPQLSLTTSPVANLSPTTTELRTNPAATTKDNAGTTTTNNSLTTTDLTLPSTLSPSAPSNGPLVRPGNLFTPGSTTPAPTQSGTTNTQSTTGTTTTTTDTTMTTTTGTSTTTDGSNGSNTTDQAGGNADGS